MTISQRTFEVQNDLFQILQVLLFQRRLNIMAIPNDQHSTQGVHQKLSVTTIDEVVCSGRNYSTCGWKPEAFVEGLHFVTFTLHLDRQKKKWKGWTLLQSTKLIYRIGGLPDTKCLFLFGVLFDQTECV